MPRMIEAGEDGSLLVPPGAAGPVPSGARFTVEPHGNVVILRREPSAAEDWWATTTPAQRVAWLGEWIASLPPSPAALLLHHQPPVRPHEDRQDCAQGHQPLRG